MIDKNQLTRVRKNGSLDVYTLNDGKPDPGCKPTQQQFKDECDINNIMKRYETTGEFTHLTSKQGQFADFSEITDFQEMLDTVKYAQDAFASLPALVRKRFDNDPGQLLQFVQDPQNKEEGIKLGLINDSNPPNPPQKSTPTPTPKTKQTNTPVDPE